MATEGQTPEKVPTLRHRRLVISTNVLVQIIFALALLGMVNWLASRHYARFDWTKAGYYQLSDKTKQMLGSLKEPVRVVVFIPPSDQREYVEKLLQDVRNLLKEFQVAGKANLSVEFVDPQRDLARAQQLVQQFKIETPDVVIFVKGDRHKFVRLDDMVDLDPGNPYSQQPPRVRAFKAEGQFLAALQSVIEEKPPQVYFLTGHGERDPDEFDQRNGYSELARYIKRDNITVAKWNLLEKQAMPTDAGAVVIAGPRTPFTPTELIYLDDFLKKHGRLLVMLDPRTKTGLEDFLKQWGVQADDDLVLASGGKLLGAELLLAEAVGQEYAKHPITRKLEDVNTVFPYTRSIRSAAPAGAPTADQPQVTELVKAPAAFWGETNADTDRAAFDEQTDLKGPLSLAAAVELGRTGGVDLGLTRMVVLGTSRLVDNSHVQVGGAELDFVMNALNWLLQREQLVAVGPKVPQEFSLNMSANQVRAVYALVIGGLPLAVVTLGLLVWVRRRK
jgi:ABC-type uncharacterized transport system involved in gliding motility auxiliary subunit